ncbi:WD40 repeat protein [Selaginella moellendorffii]|uniref:WD40 repeat protein n=1 Tax=Selaginella moellendorffii TaxID=88036 RepID=D8RCB7_SELML|nr:WD repeat-containing protein DWA2 [Selaginella moellendorffii]EFJ30103.1 WD40 repeat protein [Selaginella moellendorffii]|eukprot:XP_002968987.1 WD repeat-containing protein DWA2 [Selaginella moellendorffii]
MQGSQNTYGVKYQARCIAAVVADTQRTRFLVGTLSLREENEIHLLQIGDKTGALAFDGLYTHPSEIWGLSACPFDVSILSTVYASAGEFGAAIWKLPERARGAANTPLQKLASLDGHTQRIKCTLWFPKGKHHQIVSIDAENLYVWDLDPSGKPAKELGRVSSGLQQMAGGCWSPHDVDIVATACGTSLKCWDLRTMREASTVDQAHAGQVRDLDYNPKRQHTIVTSGDDSKVRVWDLRMSGMPLSELPGHAHWTLRVQYNRRYEELILSAGTDAMVNLWYVPPPAEGKSKSSLSSPKISDPLVRSHHEHEDSIYGIAWSARDPWVFASLSYDGNVYIDYVTQAVRKKLTSK